MDRYHQLNVNQWIDGRRFDKDFVIDDDTIDEKEKSLTDELIDRY
jgi:hypothetical protein